MKNTFKKTERLHSKLLIGKLFANGSSFFLHPFRITTIITPRDEEPPVQIMISASKRNFRSAVDRNRIKRLVRESYRKNSYIIHDSYKDKPETQLLISIVYVGKTIEPYSEIERKLIIILHRLIEKDEGTNR